VALESAEIPAENVAEVVTSEPVFSREVPALDPNGLPQGWSVQLGSFADARNASNLLQRLLSADYRAYTRALPGNGAQMTAVFVGPWLERELAADYQKRLQDEFQLSGLVVRFEVEPLQD
jgi:DedD protein